MKDVIEKSEDFITEETQEALSPETQFEAMDYIADQLCIADTIHEISNMKGD